MVVGSKIEVAAVVAAAAVASTATAAPFWGIPKCPDFETAEEMFSYRAGEIAVLLPDTLELVPAREYDLGGRKLGPDSGCVDNSLSPTLWSGLWSL